MKSHHYYDRFAYNNPITSFLVFSSNIVLMLVAVLSLYMIIFKIDIVTTASGKIVPEGKVKTLQPLIDGKVLEIHAQDRELSK